MSRAGRVFNLEAMMRSGSFALCMMVALASGSLALAGASKGDSIGTLRFADAEGRAIVLDTPGVVYLVDFWALGCKPCIQEVPELERLAKEYEPAGRFRLVSVVWGGFRGKDLSRVAEQAGTTLPIYSDPENWHDRLDVDGFPTKLFVRDGTVLARTGGGVAGLYQRWKAEVERALKVAGAVRSR